ncbi:DUF6398 domain-containing protein [Vibrio splendidus]|uniref:DUF6398 domain-containing protein n=2 Tax=Vibrio splendidus TaxID=29497 RepID=UPI0030CA30D7
MNYAKIPKSQTVPKSLTDKFDEITTITDQFCNSFLNDEYAEIIRNAVASLCRKRPSPLTKGKASSWACGITHAMGMVNFLFDASQTPHISAGKMYKEFGVAESTGQGKSKQVRTLLKMRQFDPKWSLRSKLVQNPMAWMVSVDGYIVDIRTAPVELQQMAYENGLIPFMPK